ncbi:MAG TPA: radical SAM protein [Candidatus Polarisedimenticolia bacterium]|nr:radical SAM protein [Candidatus Polarisedimenticolia bacterium]
METDIRRNPALLKLDLYCRGMRLDDSCYVVEDGGRQILRTRAGLGSGLELILPGGLWTNVPVTEKFAAASPYVLYREQGRYVLRRHRERSSVASASFIPSSRSEEGIPVRLAPRPAWYERSTSSGKPMTRIGTLQGTYLGIYQAKVCEYWTEKPKVNCRFCSVGLNLGVDDDTEKSVDEVMEVVRAAREESEITYVDFNTGHYEGDTYLDILEPFLRRVKEETGLLAGVQTPPHHDLKRYDYLRDLGVNRASFCFEIFDEEIFKKFCPGKAREYGLSRYLGAVEYCARLSRAGWEPWVSNGEIIAGLEPPASSIAAIDWIASVGAIPTVCVFRPLTGTDMEDFAPPKTEELVPLFRRLYEACMEKDLPIGVAPNVHVSLVLLPEECRHLMDNPRKYWWKELRLRALSKAFAMRFQRRVERRLRYSRRPETSRDLSAALARPSLPPRVDP